MKVGICVTTHRSQNIRPQGKELLDIFFNEFKNSNFNYDYTIYISDNASLIPYKYPNDLNLNIIKIQDQSIKGLTGAWNLGLNEAYKEGCDVLWNFNDDIVPNNTMNQFIKLIEQHPERHDILFGPLSDNGGSVSPNTSLGPKEGYQDLNIKPNSWDNLPNGFSFGFTRKFYEKYRSNKNEFFPINHKLNGGDGKWGGQEGYFSIISEFGAKACLINECWLQHFKLRSYETARDTYKQLIK